MRKLEKVRIDEVLKQSKIPLSPSHGPLLELGFGLGPRIVDSLLNLISQLDLRFQAQHAEVEPATINLLGLLQIAGSSFYIPIVQQLVRLGDKALNVSVR